MTLIKRSIKIISVAALFFIILPGLMASQEAVKKQMEEAKKDAENKDFLGALRKYKHILETIKGGNLEGEALFFFGYTADKAALDLIFKAYKDFEKEGKEPTNEVLASWDGLKPYRELGVVYTIEHHIPYLYDGEAYRQLLLKYPKSQWACGAKFMLYLIELKKSRGDSRNLIEDQLQAVKTAEKYYAECHFPEIEVEILAFLLKQYNALKSNTMYKESEYFDLKKAEEYLNQAEEICRTILAKYPNSKIAVDAEYCLKKIFIKDREIIKNGGIRK